MAALHRRHGGRCIFMLTTLTLLLFISASTATLTQTANYGTMKEREEKERSSGLRALIDRFLARRRLTGPGSSPPACRSKCGRCSPCKPVHVPIHPGMSKPLEYYPEAWRCECGNKLFVP